MSQYIYKAAVEVKYILITDFPTSTGLSCFASELCYVRCHIEAADPSD